MTRYHYVVQFEAAVAEWQNPVDDDTTIRMGHTARSTFESRHEAVGWMANRMRENPETAYRLDVYDPATGDRVEKGERRVHP